MPVERLRQYLEEHHVRYVSIKHPPAFTAQAIAASAHLPGRDLAKTVVVKLDGAFAMAVLAAGDKVSAGRLREASGAEVVELASEKEFAELFPRCEVGAMPPFGNLWGMRVFVDERLVEGEEIAFSAGSHTELIRLSYADYARLVNPSVAHLSTRN